mmetsp:Transcript_50043/g.116922  ORF Transcript_50043/g.116922 Transcript_50043/m.116922 type:complete len:203 (-) Transcript_50043:388-996(-)
MLIIGSRGLYQDIEGVLLFKRVTYACSSLFLQDEVDCCPVAEFHCRKHFTQVTSRQTKGLLYLLKVFAAEEGYVHALRTHRHQNSQSGDDTECPFRADEQLRERVAGVVFPQGAKGVDNSSICKDCFNSKDVSTQRAISQVSQTTSVCGRIATNCARALRSQVQGDHVPMLSQVVIQSLQNTPCLHSDNAGAHVQCFYILHT